MADEMSTEQDFDTAEILQATDAGSDDKPEVSDNVDAPTETGEDGWVNITEDGGIKKKILVASDDPATPPDGAEITCHYVGTLTANGHQFDSSRDRGQPFNFKLGAGRVIKCWDLGMKTLRRGEKAILRCTAEYGYGANGAGNDIPPNAGLDFEVELLDFDDTIKVKNGVSKRVIVPGQGWDTPKPHAHVIFSYKARLSESEEKGATFDEGETISWDMEDEEDKYFEGFRIAVESLKMNEKSLFKIPAAVAFGSEGRNDFASGIDVPPDATVFYEIDMHMFHNGKEAFECKTNEEKLELAQEHRDKGNEFFKKQRFVTALQRYEKASDILKSNFESSEDPEIRTFTIAVNNNLAMVQIKLENFTEALARCDDVLIVDPQNIKALTRRGHANMLQGEFREAKKDLSKALELEPENQFIGSLMKRCKKEIKRYKAKQKKLYGKMFG